MEGTRASGERCGAFTIERLLARGGVGEVYLARSESSGEQVALKLLADFSPSAAVRFEREAKILRRLSHPRIVALREFGRTAEGLPFIAMERLLGEPLDAVFTRSGIDASQLLEVAIQLCDGLAFAHAQGVIHRDLKPSNVFLVTSDRGVDARLLDFGIARLAGERSLTMTGGAIGTWAYMSPEQGRGERDIDARTDLWSLGVMLYEGLAASLPFEADSPPAMLCKIIFDDPDDLATRRPDVPRALCETVMACLSKNRSDRPESAAALGERLRAMRDETAAIARTVRVAARDRVSRVPGEMTSENRLVSVVLLARLTDRALVERLAREFAGRLVSLTGGAALVVFGVDAWSGDEPLRAVRFALLVAPAARSAGVGTGRVVREGAVIQGAAVESAAAAVRNRRDDVWVDARTAEAVQGAFDLEPHADGVCRVAGAKRARELTPADAGDLLLGRSLELAMLARAADEAVRLERPHAVVVLGAPGMGKSRVRHEAVRALRATHPGVRLIAVRGEAFRRETPFAALQDALADAIDPGVANLFDLRGGDPQAEIDRARTSLEIVLGGLAEEAPVVIVVDDAQWIDAPSRETLQWIAENASDLPIVLWVFARSDAREIATSIAASPQILELTPLASSDALALLRRIAPTAPADLVERAGGNPLFLEGLARLHRERSLSRTTTRGDLPVSIEGALMAQLDRLPAVDRDYLRRAAIFGDVFWAEGVRALGGSEESLSRLRRADIVDARRRSRVDGAREFSFRTSMCRDVAYELWPPDVRAGLHGAAGAWLEGAGAFAPAEIARHLDLAGDVERAARAYAAAAEIAARAADVNAACRHADRVTALTRDARLRWRALVARDDVLQLTGDVATQRRGIADLEALAAELGPAERAEAQWRRCYVLRLVGETEAALAAGILASDLAVQLALHRIAALAQIELTYLFVAAGRESLARDYGARASAAAERSGDVWLTSRAQAAMAFVLWETAHDVEAIGLYERAASGFGEAGDRRREALISANAASLMLDLGRIEEAAARVTAALEAARRVGNARTAAASQHVLGLAERMMGRFDVARAMQDRADAEAEALAYGRLRAAIAVERCYLGLAAGADDLALRSSRALEATRSAGSAPLAASAAAVALRVAIRERRATDEMFASVRSRLGTTTNLLLRVELAIALLENPDPPAADVDLARRAVDAWVTAIAPLEDDAETCRRALSQRFLFDASAAEPRVRSALASVIRVLRVVG
jgi:hypothetical protein